jgi:hypothetical protein
MFSLFSQNSLTHLQKECDSFRSLGAKEEFYILVDLTFSVIGDLLIVFFENNDHESCSSS